MSIQNPERLSQFIPPSERNNYLGTGSKSAYELLMRRKRRNANITAGLIGVGVICLFAFPYIFVNWKNEQNKAKGTAFGYEKGVVKSMSPDGFTLQAQMKHTKEDIEREQRETAMALLRAKKRELDALKLQEQQKSQQ